jgi:hypothetical protein
VPTVVAVDDIRLSRRAARFDGGDETPIQTHL